MPRYNIPNYKLHTFFNTLTKVSAVAALIVVSTVSGNLAYQYRKAVNFTVDDSKEIRIDCDPRAPKASFPSQYTPYAQITMDSPVNCDSSGAGVCIVQSCTIRTHSHAGTHADQPKHFVKNPPFQRFPDEFYNGEVLVINLADYLNPKDPKIDQNVLNHALEQIHGMKMFKVEVPFLSTVVNKLRRKEHVKRIILKTTDRHNEQVPLGHSENYSPYFTVDGADFLIKSFPELCLVGIDSISVDQPTASPIGEHVHGIFWNHQIAILENLRLNNFSRNIQVGKMKTYWNPYQIFEDAIGCIVTYSPARDPLENLSNGMRLDYIVRDAEFKQLQESA